jgi:two-component system LytT family response regulator
MTLRTLIVDDEPLARERLRSLLAGDADVEVVGECADGRSAVSAIRDLDPDLVFLDVQMPALNGLGVVAEVGADRMPATVFVTAFDRYAVRAFDVNAVDYLLKPFDRDRFAEALRRAKAQVGRRADAGVRDRLLALLAESRAAPQPPPSATERLAVKSGGKVVFVRVDEIDWIEAAGNYCRLHVGKQTHLLRETMAALETRLNPKKFVRIHRSTIMNLERVRELQPYFHGDYVVVLRDGTQLTLSRTYRQKLHEIIGHPF